MNYSKTVVAVSNRADGDSEEILEVWQTVHFL